MVSHRRSAKERRAQRSRAEARFIGRILRGCRKLAVHRGAKAGDIISSLADNLRGRAPHEAGPQGDVPAVRDRLSCDTGLGGNADRGTRALSLRKLR